GIEPAAMAMTIDFAPTFVEIAGGTPPARYEGRSLVSLLRGETPADWRTSVLIEYFSDTVFPRMHKMAYKAARTENWKYVRYSEQDEADELYNLQNDPYELNNLIEDPASREHLAKMQSELERLLVQVAAAGSK